VLYAEMAAAQTLLDRTDE